MGLDSSLNKHGNIDHITRRAGYGGVFTPTGRKHPRVATAARNRGEGRVLDISLSPICLAWTINI